MHGGWNKGKKWSQAHKDKLSEIHKKSISCQKHLEKLHKTSKGKHLSPTTEFKKGNIPWSKLHPELTPRRENSCHWKGGKIKQRGYVFICSPNHPFAHNSYVREHRLVIEKQIGRYLKPQEKVHHLGAKDDNRPQMLMAFVNHSAHVKFENGQSIPPSDIIFDGRKL